MDWPGRFALWVTNKLPLLIVKEPERVFLQLAGIAIGIAVLVIPAPPHSLRDVLPSWVIYEWATTLVVGGILTLWGMQSALRHALRSNVLGELRSRALERLGVAMFGLGCLIYGISVLLTFQTSRLPTAFIFTILGLAKCIRLLVSAAGRSYLNGRASKPKEVDEDAQ